MDGVPPDRSSTTTLLLMHMRNPFKSTTAKSARAKRSLTLLGVIAILAAVGGIAYAAAGPAVPTPTISAGPSGATGATSASFSFAVSGTGYTLQCSLDTADFSACTSPKAYAGPLAPGAHTFRVRARRTSDGSVGSPATRTWTVDTAAPVITFLRPLDGASYNAASWAANCASHPGMCGNTADPSGVASNKVSVRQVSTGKYWNGSAFASATEVFGTVDGFTSWRYAMPALPAEGSYVVHARSTDAVGNTTAPADQLSLTFSIDTHAPVAPTISGGPANPTSAKQATFAFADAEAGVQFLCKLDTKAYEVCNASETFKSLADGTHTVSVQARDAAGNVSPTTTYTWRVDTAAPPKPTITQKPADPSAALSATFAFTDTEAGVVYECRLDGGAWATCASPVTYSGLSAARHTFGVRALDAAANASAATEYSWTVSSQTGRPFNVGGNLTGLLAPGLSGTLILTLSNPNGEAIHVTSLTVTVQPGSTKAGCDGPANLQITQSSASAANELVVPANGSVTLPSGGVSAPQVLMRNLPTNQDACKGATFSFSYGGSAHS